MRFLGRPFILLLIGFSLLTNCSSPLSVPDFSTSGPLFNPVEFFTGHVTSWGVEEGRGGAPISIITTDCLGIKTGPQSLRMVQVLHIDGAPPQTRIWQLRQITPTTYVATANDMAGSTTATVSGRTLHWRWTLETVLGQAWKNVTVEQWMYHMDDGAVMIRTVITKFHIRLLQVSEQFQKQPR